MLQAGIEKVKSLLNGKAVYIASACILLVLGLTYYFINSYGGKTSEEPEDLPESRLADISEQVMVIVVDVSGAVNNPGLYSLDNGSRVGEAVALAGGISSDASVAYVSKILNLAQKLNDMDKVYIPFEMDMYVGGDYEVSPLVFNPQPVLSTTSNQNQTQTISASSAAPGTTVSQNIGTGTNANTSSLEALDSLSGIGPAYAQRIIDNRPYKDFAELVSKSGIPKTILEKIKTLITF